MTPVVKKQAVAKPLLKKSGPGKTIFTEAPKAQHIPVASLASKTPATKKAARLRVTGIANKKENSKINDKDEGNISEKAEDKIADKIDNKIDNNPNNNPDNTTTDNPTNNPDNKTTDKPDNKVENNITNTNNNKKNNKSSKNSWQWGINAGAGISDLGMQLFKSTRVTDFAYSGNGGMVTPLPVPPSTPSDINPGASFQLGAYVSKGISKKLAIKLGLNYEYYSNTISVGTHYNNLRVVNQGPNLSMVDQYYSAGNDSKFTNKYHFVSLPLSMQWKINKNPKHGIVWENGVSFARMVSASALHYDGISGTYYKDNSLFNKTQWIASSSLLFSIKSKSTVQLYAGPQLQYGISNIIDGNTGNNNHLRYAGLKIMAGFNKK